MIICKKQVSFDNALRIKLNYVLCNEENVPEVMDIFQEMLGEKYVKVRAVERYKDRMYAEVTYIKFQISNN